MVGGTKHPASQAQGAVPTDTCSVPPREGLQSSCSLYLLHNPPRFCRTLRGNRHERV